MPKGKVPEHVKRAMRGEIDDPQLSEIAAHFFQMAGGSRAVAKMLLDEFNAAGKGSLTRQRILDMLLRVQRVAEEKTGQRDPLGLLSEEDLDRELEASIVRMPSVANEQGPERTTEAAAEAEPQGQASEGDSAGAVA